MSIESPSVVEYTAEIVLANGSEQSVTLMLRPSSAVNLRVVNLIQLHYPGSHISRLTSKVNEIIELKTQEPWFTEVWSKEKGFYISFRDREFIVGQWLHLRQFYERTDHYGDRSIMVRIKTIYTAVPGVKEGYVILILDQHSQHNLTGSNGDRTFFDD